MPEVMSNTTLLLISIMVIMLAAVPMVAIMKNFLPQQIEKAAHIDENENKIYVLHSEIHEAQNKLNGLNARRNTRSSDIHRIETDTRKLEKAIRDIEHQPPLFVHEVGEPRANLTKFMVNLNLTRSADSRSGPLNPIWRCANVAEVWAANFDEAKQAVEIAFPFKLGFTKAFLKQPPAGAGSGAAAAAAATGNPGAASAALVASGNEEAGADDFVPMSTGMGNDGQQRELRRPAMSGPRSAAASS